MRTTLFAVLLVLGFAVGMAGEQSFLAVASACHLTTDYAEVEYFVDSQMETGRAEVDGDPDDCTCEDMIDGLVLSDPDDWDGPDTDGGDCYSIGPFFYFFMALTTGPPETELENPTDCHDTDNCANVAGIINNISTVLGFENRLWTVGLYIP